MKYEVITDKLNPTKPLIPLDIAKIKYLVLHHVEADNYPWQQCNEDHKANGWNCAGYNEYIVTNGDVYIMRGDNIGAQCQGYNSSSYGIGVEGNYDNFKVMPPEQYSSLMQRINYNLKRFPKGVLVVPHNQLYDTKCPGKFFPLVRILSDINTMDLELAAALAILKTDGIVNTAEYWQTHAKNGDTCKGEYVRQLILNMAKNIK